MRLDCPRQKTGRAKAVVASPLRSNSGLFPHNAIREIVRIEELTDRLYSIGHRNHVLTRKLGVVRGSRHCYGIITLKILLCRSKRSIKRDVKKKSSASSGGEISFSRSSPLKFQVLWRSLACCSFS